MENELLDGHNLDLPLSANFHEIEVVHFILDLSCSLENKSFQGALTIFCRISNSKEKLKENKRKLYEAESCESLLKIECQNCQQCYHKVPMHMTESEFTELHPHEVLKDNLTSSSSAGQNEHIKTNEEICFCKDKTNAHFLNDSIRCSEIILDCSTIDVEHCILYDTSNITSEISVDEIKGMIKPMNMVMECFCKNTSLPETSYLHISQCCMEKYLKYYTFLKALTTENLMDLKFKVSDHSLTIYLPEEVRDKSGHVIKINFMTRPEGPSLMWTLDQTNMPCVFTIGHQLNNRSLFPSQDMPQAMSTWHCFITLGKVENEKTTVLMTGEAPANIIQNEDEIVYQFSNSYPMPASTFALAVGCWKFTDLSSVIQANEHPIGSSFQAPTCHLFSPSNLEPHTTDLMSRYLPMCFRSLDIVLGPYPLKHLNILIVPDCFDSLGMASPHLILLSQSVLCPDMSMLLRLAHELCHTWFGILTGPRDWTEEWLTEGVCCYLEDIIHGMIMDWDEDRLNLRALIKYKLLASEITNTSEHLQTLRPNEGVDDTPGSSDKKVFVKNGLDPEKTLNQVHYLKGYFLLLNLQQVAGKELFLDTVKTFINDHLGRLFSSQEFLIYIFDHCASLGFDLTTEFHVHNADHLNKVSITPHHTLPQATSSY